MSKLLRNITVRVVGVSFQNDDGTDRQEILSELSIGEAMLLKYYEYDGEPAYAVTDALGNQIGNLPKDLSSDIYREYRNCYFAVQIDKITGGDDGLKFGCIISIDIYDTEPDFTANINVSANTSFAASVQSAPQNTPQKKVFSDKASNFYGIIYIILGGILALVGLLLLLVTPIGGILAIIFGILAIIVGRKFRKKVKEHRASDV